MVALADGNFAAAVGPQVVIVNGDTGEVVARKIIDIPTGNTTDIVFNGLQVTLHFWRAPACSCWHSTSTAYAVRAPQVQHCARLLRPLPLHPIPYMQVMPDGNLIVKNIGRPAGCPAQGYAAVTGAH